jgi:prepilin-type N-terminal cleavage/methylation domain-containing protein
MRDPQQGKKGFSANKGFTVIELMIAVAVIAIITSLALPSYRSLIEKRQVTSGAQQLSAFMSAAQSEAIKRNREVALTCTLETGQCEALVLARDDDEEDESLRTLVFANLKAEVVAVSYDGADEQVVFDPVRGMLIPQDVDPSPIEIQLSSAQGEYALNVTMLATGRVTMCSDGVRASKVVPGYNICG